MKKRRTQTRSTQAKPAEPTPPIPLTIEQAAARAGLTMLKIDELNVPLKYVTSDTLLDQLHGLEKYHAGGSYKSSYTPPPGLKRIEAAVVFNDLYFDIRDVCRGRGLIVR